jgi:hypothetical protein
MLQCLLVAVRPLRVEELAELSAFEFSEAQEAVPKYSADWRWEDQEEAVLSTCSSLITIVNDHGSPVVQFSHFSVKEFLVSNRLQSSLGDLSQYYIPLGPAHTILAEACLGCLLYLDDHMDANDLSLADYAAEHWVEHVQVEGITPRVKVGMTSLFNPDKPHFGAWFAAWVGTYLIDEPYQTYREFFSRMPTPLYRSSLSGSGALVERPPVVHPQRVYALGDWYGFALLAALRRKHFPVAEILLSCGVSVDLRGMRGRTLLHNTIRQSDADILGFLLEHGADAHARDEDYVTPWLLARYLERFDIARMLLYHDTKLPTEND